MGRAVASLYVTAAVVASCCLLPSGVALDNGLGKKPPRGWSTWQTCGDDSCGHDVCTEQEVKAVATAMQQNGMHAAGYNYVNLDDCWASKNRTAKGNLMWDLVRFPSGIPALTAWLHERNFSFGIYTSAGSTTCNGVAGSRYHYGRDAQSFADWGVECVSLAPTAYSAHAQPPVIRSVP
jgi:alpha-galactosidase